MQKLLNTPSFALYPFWQRVLLLNRKAGLLAGLTLLLLTGLVNPAKAGSGFYKNFVVINGQYYYTNSPGNSGLPSFQTIGNNGFIGQFDRGVGELRLGAEANTFNDNGDDVQSTQLFYRVYQQNTTPGPFTPLGLGFLFAGGDGPNNKRWSNTSANPNLVLSTNNIGIYVLEVYFEGKATYNNSGGKGNFNILDNNSSQNYRVTFEVTGSVPLEWTGNAKDANWFNANNWSPVGTPNASTDVRIPYVLNGTAPSLSNGTAEVRTLRIFGDPAAPGSRNFFLRGAAILRVFGDFYNSNGAFDQSGGLFTLAGDRTQTFEGAVFTDIRIEGKSLDGKNQVTKILTNQMEVTNSLTFAPDSKSLLRTGTGNPGETSVILQTTARIIGESETSYISGFLRSVPRAVNKGFTNTFSGIGVELTPNAADAGQVSVTRFTGVSATGIGGSKSIKRSFTFTSTNSENLSFSLVFRYLDADLKNEQEVQYIDESKLLLFRSFSGSIPFTNLGKTSADPNANTLTRTFTEGTLAATFTLGDQSNPLPVTITSFTAVAEGTDAVLNWATATEQNSQGFEVQVSSDAKTYSKLGFVTSTANSSTPRSYQYRDVTAGKAGTRYYRLRQLDLDGKEAFIGPKAVVFGAPMFTSVRAYPNPFGSEVNLSLQTIAAGPATVSVIDGVGRQVRAWQPTLAAGASTLTLPGLQNLSKGLYIMQVRYSDGQTQRLKLVKE